MAVVAFFISARLGAQDTLEAFTEVVLEQLAQLLGQGLPPWPAATRDARLLEMLERAAQACNGGTGVAMICMPGCDQSDR